MVAGAPYTIENGGSDGAVYVYKKINGVWTEQKKLVDDIING